MSLINTLWEFALKNIVEIALVASILMLGGAYGFEIIGGLNPCELCWPQRYAHMAVIVFASFALVLRKINPSKWLRFKAMTTLAYLISVCYSGYHAGVEQKWWKGPDGCTAPDGAENLSMEEFLKQLDNVALIRCDDIPWELFGISMAGYNFMISLVLFIMLAISLKKDIKA